MISQVMGHTDYMKMGLQVPQYNSGKHLFNGSPFPAPYRPFQLTLETQEPGEFLIWAGQLQDGQRPKPPIGAASTVGLRGEGLREGEKTGVEGCWHSMGFPDLSVHRTKRKRRNVSSDFKTNLDYANSNSLSNIRCYGSTITSDRLEKQNHHREWWESIRIWRKSWMICWSLHILFLLILFIYLHLCCSTKIFVRSSKRLWIKSANYRGKMAE